MSESTAAHSHSYHDQKADLIQRLNRLEGQIRGISTMVEGDRYCVDILQQLAAARSAGDAIAHILLENHIRGCVAEGVLSGNGDERISEVMSVIKRYIKI